MASEWLAGENYYCLELPTVELCVPIIDAAGLKISRMLQDFDAPVTAVVANVEARITVGERGLTI